MRRLSLFGMASAACVGASLGLLALARMAIPGASPNLVLAVALMGCPVSTAAVWLASCQADRRGVIGALIVMVVAPVVAGGFFGPLLAVGLYFVARPAITFVAAATVVVGIVAGLALLRDRAWGPVRVAVAVGLSVVSLLALVPSASPSVAAGGVLGALDVRFGLALDLGSILVAAAAVGGWAAMMRAQDATREDAQLGGLLT